jgi:hypothetical protein
MLAGVAQTMTHNRMQTIKILELDDQFATSMYLVFAD